MKNNEILRAIINSLSLTHEQALECVQLGNAELQDIEISRFLVSKRVKDEYQVCNNETLEAFLNGLITQRRGDPETKPDNNKKPPIGITTRASVNNVVLKKLKIALNFTNEDILEAFIVVNVELSKSQITSFFRKEGHKNFRKLGDDYLIFFLKGVAIIESEGF